MRLRLFFLILPLISVMNSKALFIANLGPTGMLYVNTKIQPFKDYREQLQSIIKQNENVSRKAFLLHINRLPKFPDVAKLKMMNEKIVARYPEILKRKQTPRYDFGLDDHINRSTDLDMIGLLVSPSKLTPNELLTKKALLEGLKVTYMQYDMSDKTQKKLKIPDLRKKMMIHYEKNKFSNMYGGLLEVYDFDNNVLTFYVLHVNPNALIKYLAE